MQGDILDGIVRLLGIILCGCSHHTHQSDGAYLRFEVITETDIHEVDAAILHLFHGIPLRILDVGILTQYLYDTLAAGSTHRQHHEDHAQHHQRGEDRHHVSKERGELSGGQVTHHDIVCAKPGEGDHTTVYHQHHHRVVDSLQRLGLDEQSVEGIGRLLEFLILEVLPHESLHHPDGRDILLYGIVQVVVSLEHLREEFYGARDDQIEGCSEDDQCHQEDQTHLEIDEYAHQYREDQV